MKTKDVIATTQKRMYNIDKALQADGANPQDIHHSMLFGIIALLKVTYRDSLSDDLLRKMVDDVLETIKLENENALITQH
tara:strand:+ start:8151 stop:8390 length:240 start_codon:yes stop_codon:yes gene_type:complete